MNYLSAEDIEWIIDCETKSIYDVFSRMKAANEGNESFIREMEMLKDIKVTTLVGVREKAYTLEFERKQRHTEQTQVAI